MILDSSVFEHFKSSESNNELVIKNLYGVLLVNLSDSSVSEQTISESDFSKYEIFSNEVSDDNLDITKSIIEKINELRQSEKYDGYNSWPSVTLL